MLVRLYFWAMRDNNRLKRRCRRMVIIINVWIWLLSRRAFQVLLKDWKPPRNKKAREIRGLFA
jgi:hypothetical protein